VMLWWLMVEALMAHGAASTTVDSGGTKRRE